MKIIASAGRVAGWVAAIMLAILTLLTVSDVCGRFFFTHPIIGTTELTEYMLAIMAFFAIAWAAVAKRHIVVDLVMSRFSPRIQMIVDSITCLLSICIYAIIAWRLVMEGVDLQALSMVSTFLDVPKYPFYYVAALGCTLLTLVAIVNLIQRISMIKGWKQ